MKASSTKLAETSQTPGCQIAIRKRDERSKAANPDSKSQKRENIFSQSRDTREDRSARQMKTAQSPQTFPHVR